MSVGSSFERRGLKSLSQRSPGCWAMNGVNCLLRRNGDTLMKQIEIRSVICGNWSSIRRLKPTKSLAGKHRTDKKANHTDKMEQDSQSMIMSDWVS
ncbi:hypothetical protein LUU34_00708400 [Aix galericulata]|nr:hypothetical protein LUU34_00708400 [Aix galericulata]